MRDLNQDISKNAAGTTFSNVFETEDWMRSVEVVAKLDTVSGSSPTLDITLQFSDDGQTFVDEDSMTQIVGTGTSRLNVALRYRYARLKFVVGGTTPVFTGSIRMTGSADDEVVDQPSIANVTCTLANTEYSQAIPTGCKKYLVKARGANDINLAFTSGASGTTYVTIPAGSGGLWVDGSRVRGVTAYFQSPDAGAVVELLFVK